MEDFSSNKPFFLGLSLKVWVLIILICVFLGLVLYQANNKLLIILNILLKITILMF